MPPGRWSQFNFFLQEMQTCHLPGPLLCFALKSAFIKIKFCISCSTQAGIHLHTSLKSVQIFSSDMFFAPSVGRISRDLQKVYWRVVKKTPAENDSADEYILL
jgi:hypothetical protein